MSKPTNSQLDVFIIHPIKNATDEELALVYAYTAQLEKQGKKVHLPHRDTVQTDPHGMSILTTNCEAVYNAKQIHILWLPTKSSGSLFDFGMTFMALKFMPEKKIVLINPKDVKPTNHKSFENVLLKLTE